MGYAALFPVEVVYLGLQNLRNRDGIESVHGLTNGRFPCTRASDFFPGFPPREFHTIQIERSILFIAVQMVLINNWPVFSLELLSYSQQISQFYLIESEPMLRVS